MDELSLLAGWKRKRNYVEDRPLSDFGPIFCSDDANWPKLPQSA